MFSVASKCCRVKVIEFDLLLDRRVNLLKFVKGRQNTELRAWCLDEIHWFAYLSNMLITIMDLLSFVDFFMTEVVVEIRERMAMVNTELRGCSMLINGLVIIRGFSYYDSDQPFSMPPGIEQNL